MCKINPLDLCAMQECLDGYKRLVQWVPSLDTVDEEMKQDRLRIIEHLDKRCEELLVELSKNG